MRLSVEMTIHAPASRIWAILAHRFDRIGEWASAIPASRAAAGAVRETGAPVAGRVCETGVRMYSRVEETIIDYDELGRALTYVGRGLPGFIAEARNRVSVVALDHGRSRVTMQASVRPRGLVGRMLAVPLRLQFEREGRRTLADLKHYVENGRPSRRKERRLAGH